MDLRRAEPARDSAALCALARRCPQGRRLRFYHHREDYWERARLHADAEVLVLDDGGRLAGSVTVARKVLLLGGVPTRAAYVFDLMVDPDLRGRGLARRLLDVCRRACPDARLFYSYILEDNVASRRLYESEGFTAHPHRLLYHPVLPGLVRRRPPPGLRRADAEAADAEAWLRQRYDFLDTTAGHDGLFVLKRGGSRAWAALRRHGPQVFVGVPWYWGLLGRVVPLLPAPGRPLRVWSLHHLGGEGSDAGAGLRRVVAAVAWLAARERVGAVVLPLFANDPRAADVRPLTLTRWGIAPGGVRLYVAGESAGRVLAAARPLLVSGKDG